MKQEPEQVPPPVMKVSPPVISNSRYTGQPTTARKRPPSASKNDDGDWVMDTPKRTRPSRNNEHHHKKVEPEQQ